MAESSASHKILGGRVSVYKQKKSKNFFARFYHDGKQYATTLKTAAIAEADHRAENWFIDTMAAIRNGIQPKPTQIHPRKAFARNMNSDFREAADKALAEYRTDGHSLKYVNCLRKMFNKLTGLVGDQPISEINQATWTKLKERLRKSNPSISPRTLHQHKNALMVVLKQAYLRGELKEQVAFVREFTGINQDTPRTYFSPDEYEKLIKVLRTNIANARKIGNGHVGGAEELRDFCIWMVNTGMRIGEAMAVRFCDVTVKRELDDKGREQEFLEIRNIIGKRGRFGTCKSYYGAARAFRRIIQRYGLTEENYKQSEAIIWKAYHHEMFKTVLKENGLYQTQDRPPRRRDLMSLRHTYICFSLLRRKQPIWDIANNCRTSVEMIQKHYAAHLQPIMNQTINRNFNE